MKSAIICEGSSDQKLLQHFLERVYGWKHIAKKEYKKFPARLISTFNNVDNVDWLEHNSGCVLCIIPAGGSPKIPSRLEMILDINKIGAELPFNKVVVITDRDEPTTEQDIFSKIEELYRKFKIKSDGKLRNNTWNVGKYTNEIEDTKVIELLPLIIPFEETGSIETFLLDALCEESDKNDPEKVDKIVIEQCKHFIEMIDCKGKYLKRRREKTKAKFDTVFAVMTPASAFYQRQTLLRSVPWENYETIQKSFKELIKLSEPVF